MSHQELSTDLSFISKLITFLTAALGPLSNVGASSVAEDPVNPSLLDALDRTTMNDNESGMRSHCSCTCRMYPRSQSRKFCCASAVFLLLFMRAL